MSYARSYNDNVNLKKLALAYGFSSFLIGFASTDVLTRYLDLAFSLEWGISNTIFLFLLITPIILILTLLSPLLGHISDKKVRDKGRRRFWIKYSLIILVVTIILLYLSPIQFGISNELINVLYFSIILIFYLGAIWIFNLNYSALFPEMFQDLNLRSYAITIALTFSLIGTSTYFFVYQYLLNTIEIYIGVILGGIVIIGGVILLKYGIYEPYSNIQIGVKSNVKEKFGIFSKNNKIFLWFLVVFFFILISDSLIGMLISSYWAYLEFTSFSWAILVNLIYIIPNAVGIVFILYWRRWVPTLGIKKVLFRIMIFILILIIFLLFLNDFISGIIFISILTGFLAGIPFLMILFLSIIIDNDSFDSNRRREGLYFGIYQVLNFIAIYFSTFMVAISLIFNPWLDLVSDLETFLLIDKINYGILAIIFIGISLLLIKKISIDKETYDVIEMRIKTSDLHKSDNPAPYK